MRFLSSLKDGEEAPPPFVEYSTNKSKRSVKRIDHIDVNYEKDISTKVSRIQINPRGRGRGQQQR